MIQCRRSGTFIGSVTRFIVGVSCDRIRQFQELTFPSCEMIVDDPYQLTIRAEESANQVNKSCLVISVQFVDQLPRI